MEHIFSAIHSAAEQDAAGFRDAIHSALADKISDALELKKISIASSMFANQEEASAEETGSDEDVQATA
jgi:hypothetical protein